MSPNYYSTNDSVRMAGGTADADGIVTDRHGNQRRYRDGRWEQLINGQWVTDAMRVTDSNDKPRALTPRQKFLADVAEQNRLAVESAGDDGNDEPPVAAATETGASDARSRFLADVARANSEAIK